jgi:hypothetical protein
MRRRRAQELRAIDFRDRRDHQRKEDPERARAITAQSAAAQGTVVGAAAANPGLHGRRIGVVPGLPDLADGVDDAWEKVFEGTRSPPREPTSAVVPPVEADGTDPAPYGVPVSFIPIRRRAGHGLTS